MALGALRHADRQDRIHILSLDRFLLEDVCERLSDDPRLDGCELIRPQRATVAEADRLAAATTSSRLIVLDVRSYTLPQLQPTYNRVAGYNRRDLNEICFMVLIGDGPLRLFYPGTSIDLFVSLLASHRREYSPSVFFYDPFLHYAYDERRRLAGQAETLLPNHVPRRLADQFKQDNVDVGTVRRYVRAATVPPRERAAAKARRQRKLLAFFRKRIAQAFPDHAEQLQPWLSKEGYALGGETLRLHLYPLFFEDWVFDLLSRARDG